MNEILTWLKGLNPWVIGCGKALGIVLLALLIHFVSKRFLLKCLRRLFEKTKNKWDDVLTEKHVLNWLAQLPGGMVVYSLLPIAFPAGGNIVNLAQRLTIIYMMLMSVMVVQSILNAVIDIYRNFELSKKRPIRSYVQVVKLFLYVVSGIFVISILLNKSPWGLLVGIGGLAAVFMFVFKDTILGFSASIQLDAQDMIRRDDWIVHAKSGADGDVIDVSINVVRVRNWDKTITTIPTHELISGSFTNYRGMFEMGGRRIKRNIVVRISSVKFCTPEMIDSFEEIDILRGYLAEKRRELEEYNRSHGEDPEKTNPRQLTNVGTFRAYVAEYLKRHPKIHQPGQMTFLVRQLEPTGEGLPIQIYVFVKDTRWAYYEGIQADIFDHILAIAPEFEVEIYQKPSGSDLKESPVGTVLGGAAL